MHEDLDIVHAYLCESLMQAAAETISDDVVDNGDYYSLSVTVNINKEDV